MPKGNHLDLRGTERDCLMLFPLAGFILFPTSEKPMFPVNIKISLQADIFESKMIKMQSSAQFKSCQPQQILLLPSPLDELIGEDDMVRVVYRVVGIVDFRSSIT